MGKGDEGEGKSGDEGGDEERGKWKGGIKGGLRLRDERRGRGTKRDEGERTRAGGGLRDEKRGVEGRRTGDVNEKRRERDDES
jgi:hypothetical protein